MYAVLQAFHFFPSDKYAKFNFYKKKNFKDKPRLKEEIIWLLEIGQVEGYQMDTDRKLWSKLKSNYNWKFYHEMEV
ncbi:CLUMA_CG021100, isoform A [Clunio marinus]|uniref:CLUMA_CG021100, isoform A n=1 Tax=Clunio marinus TaxID=568069 RepID=A0A1J1JAE4_9DIPT|nr:CLUMA_CG021100, isoform A [Clunio marinus]